MTERGQGKSGSWNRRQLIQALAITGGAGFAGLALARLRNRPRIAIVPPGADLPFASPTGDRPPIIAREQWGALPVNHAAPNEPGFYHADRNPYGWRLYQGDLRDSYQTLILHHSAFYEADGFATLLEVQRLHRDDRGWADIGYHFLVDADGKIYEGRDLAARGAHTKGRNTGSAGLCLMGDFRYVAPSAAQWNAAAKLARWLVDELALTHLAGHSQFNDATLCPGAFMMARLPELAALLSLDFGTEGYVPTARALDLCDCCCQSAL